MSLPNFHPTTTLDAFAVIVTNDARAEFGVILSHIAPSTVLVDEIVGYLLWEALATNANVGAFNAAQLQLIASDTAGLGEQIAASGDAVAGAVESANADLELFLMSAVVPALTGAGTALQTPVTQIRDDLRHIVTADLVDLKFDVARGITVSQQNTDLLQGSADANADFIVANLLAGLAKVAEAAAAAGGQPIAEWAASVTPHSDPQPDNKVTTTESLSPFLAVGSATLSFLVRKLGDVFADILRAAFAGADIMAPGFQPLVDQTLDTIQDRVLKLGHVTPGDAFSVARDFLTVAMTNGLKARLIGVLCEKGGDQVKNLGIQQVAGLMGELGGFSQLAEAVWGTALKAGIGRPAEYQVNAITRSRHLAERDLADAATQRKMSLTEQAEILAFHGYDDRGIAFIQAHQWRRARLREIVMLASDASVQEDDVRNWLEEGGYDDLDVNRFTPIVMEQSLRGQRQAWQSEVMANMREGYIDDEEGEAHLRRLRMNDEGVQLLLDTGRLGARRDMINESLRTFETAFTNDQMTEEEFTLALEGIGINKAKVAIIVGRNVSKRIGRVTKEEEAMTSKQVREFQSASLAALKAQFQAQLIGAEAFASNLVALGFLPSVAREIVTLEQLHLLAKIQGTQAAEADKLRDEIRRDRIATFIEFFQDGFINDEQLLADLVQLGLDFELAQAIAFREKAKKAALPKPAPAR